MKAMFDLIRSMPLFVLISFGLLVSGKQCRPTTTEIQNRLRAIITLIELLPKPATPIETTMSNRVLEWCNHEIDELSAQAALNKLNLLYIGTVPVGHDPSMPRSN